LSQFLAVPELKIRLKPPGKRLLSEIEYAEMLGRLKNTMAYGQKSHAASLW
jgi:hypothetical protein